MLSIAIPVYNYSISDLLDVLEEQICKESVAIEIIIIDDCSTDETTRKSNEIRAKHYQYLENDTNLGRVATRLALSRKASYPWILFMDADVIPLKTDFLSSFLKELNFNYDLIFGGITYTEKLDDLQYSLRWSYGKRSEAKSLVKRKSLPYASIISQHFCIRKSLAVSVFSDMDIKAYGLDILFTYLLEKNKTNVLHIYNPTVHLGLEKNEEYLKKTINGLQTTYRLECQGLIPKSYRPVQQKSRLLSKLFITSIFEPLFSLFLNNIERNLTSIKPNLTLFGLYKLYHYQRIKRKTSIT